MCNFVKRASRSFTAEGINDRDGRFTGGGTNDRDGRFTEGSDQRLQLTVGECKWYNDGMTPHREDAI